MLLCSIKIIKARLDMLACQTVLFDFIITHIRVFPFSSSVVVLKQPSRGAWRGGDKKMFSQLSKSHTILPAIKCGLEFISVRCIAGRDKEVRCSCVG